MTELHNMSVPARSVLTLQRAELHGLRYRVAIGASAIGDGRFPDDAALTRCFREDGAACALALLHPDASLTAGTLRDRVARFRRIKNALGTLKQLCDAALASLPLPGGFGFFVDETQGSTATLSLAATIGFLAARSGPLYLPGRFEPSLITAGAVTLFFPALEEGRGVR
jgi:hypothetical protein